MTAALLAPAALGALVALALPLLIHLARTTEQRPTDFAALRWLRARPKPRRRPRLDERRLLTVRLLLLTALALGLARPVLLGAPRPQRWLAAAPGVDPATARAAAADGVAARWLAPGFPDLRRPAPTGVAPVGSLLRELDADLPPGAALTVLVPPVIDGADAERPRLSRPVAWRTARAIATPARAVPKPEPDPPLKVRVAPGREAELRPLRAAAAAWAASPSAPSVQVGPTTEPLPAGARWIAWLAAGAPPQSVLARVREGAVLLLPADARVDGLGAALPLWRDTDGQVLAEGAPLGRGRWRRFTHALTPEAMPALLQADVPARLHALLADAPHPPARVDAADYAPLTGAHPGVPGAVDLRPFVALAAAALFALERGLATRRRRAAAP